MSPAAAIALVYAIVGGGILLYLRRVRQRLRQVEVELQDRSPTPAREAVR